MALKTELRALLAGKEPEQVAEALAGVGFVPKDTDQAGQTREILSIAELAGVTDLAFVKTLIDDGKTPEEARTGDPGSQGRPGQGEYLLNCIGHRPGGSQYSP